MQHYRRKPHLITTPIKIKSTNNLVLWYSFDKNIYWVLAQKELTGKRCGNPVNCNLSNQPIELLITTTNHSFTHKLVNFFAYLTAQNCLVKKIMTWRVVLYIALGTCKLLFGLESTDGACGLSKCPCEK